MNSFSMLKLNHETYERTREIMGLSEDLDWTSVRVTFGTDDVGEVQITFLATGEQVAALAALAIQVTSS